jgi:hypothetical protein
MLTSDVSSRQIQFVPQEVGKCKPRFDFTMVFAAVDGYRDFTFHDDLFFKMTIRNAQRRRAASGK